MEQKGRKLLIVILSLNFSQKCVFKERSTRKNFSDILEFSGEHTTPCLPFNDVLMPLFSQTYTIGQGEKQRKSARVITG